MSLYNNLMEMVIDNKKEKYQMTRSRDIIQFFAETSYNNVIFENYIDSITIHNRALNEGVGSDILSKVKELFRNLIDFIKSLWNKFFNAIKSAVKKIRDFFSKDKSSSSSASSNTSNSSSSTTTNTSSNTSSNSSSSTSNSSNNGSKEENKTIFHDWKKIEIEIENGINSSVGGVMNPEDIFDKMNDVDMNALTEENVDQVLKDAISNIDKEIDSFLNKNISLFNLNFKIKDIKSNLKDGYNKIVNNNEISNPLPKNVLQEICDKALKEAEDGKEEKAELEAELKAATSFDETIELKLRSAINNEKIVNSVINFSKAGASRITKISNIMVDAFSAAIEMLLDISKGCIHDMKYAN